MLEKWAGMILGSLGVVILVGISMSHATISLPDPSSDGKISVPNTNPY